MTMQAELTDLNARIANLIRVGTVSEVNYSTARVRVDLGNSKTNWLAWVSMTTGATSSWLAPEVGEQVVILSPSGQINQGVVINGLYHNDAPPPSNARDEFMIQFGDGTQISHLTGAKHTCIRSTGNVTVHAAERIVIETNENVNIKAQNVTVTGDSVAIDCENTTFKGNIQATGIISAKNI